MRVLLWIAALGLLVTPAWADMIEDAHPGAGGFEDPGWASWNGDKQRSGGMFGPANPKEGDYWGSTNQSIHGTSARKEVWITSMYAPADATVYLDGYYAGGASGSTGQLYVQILNGSSDSSPVAAEWSVTWNSTGSGTWAPFSLAAAVTPLGHIGIKFGYHLNGWGNGNQAHLDALTLTPEPASMALFSLAGLPLLLRRRR